MGDKGSIRQYRPNAFVGIVASGYSERAIANAWAGDGWTVGAWSGMVPPGMITIIITMD
jgi:hypothetical protein